MTVRYVTRAHAQKACRTVLGLSPSLARERLRRLMIPLRGKRFTMEFEQHMEVSS